MKIQEFQTGVLPIFPYNIKKKKKLKKLKCDMCYLKSLKMCSKVDKKTEN